MDVNTLRPNPSAQTDARHYVARRQTPETPEAIVREREARDGGDLKAQVPQIRSMAFSLSMGDLHRQRITRGDMFIVRVINVHPSSISSEPRTMDINIKLFVCVREQCVVIRKKEKKK